MTFADLKSYCSCENPRIIINPRFLQFEIIPQFDEFHIAGKSYTIFDYHSLEKCVKLCRQLIPYKKDYEVLNNFDFEPVSISHDFDSDFYDDSDVYALNQYISTFLSKPKPKVKNLVQLFDDDQDIDDVYFLNTSTGEIQCPFVAVPCNRCDLCKESQRSDYSQRCNFQFMEDKRRPFFITLTYNERFNPVNVDKKSVESFIKRFKTYARRYYLIDDTKIKFFVTSEYGHEHNRPHYHMILFGWDLDTVGDTDRQLRLKKLVDFCWTTGRRDCKFSDFYSTYDHRLKYITNDPIYNGGVTIELVSNASGLLNYVTKYMTKELPVPAHLKPNFRIVPYRFGTSFFFSEIVSQVVSTLSNKVSYLDVFRFDQDGSRAPKVVELNLTKYYINKLYPCCSHMIKGELKRSFQSILGYYDRFKSKFKESWVSILDNMRTIFDVVAFPDRDPGLFFNELQLENLISDFQTLIEKHNTNYGGKPLSWILNQRALVFSGARQPINKTNIKFKIVNRYSKYQYKL